MVYDRTHGSNEETAKKNGGLYVTLEDGKKAWLLRFDEGKLRKAYAGIKAV